LKYPIKEKHSRSLTKSVTWRVLGVLFLSLVTYMVTGNWITTTLITVCHHGVFILVYYLHERAWLKISWLRNSRWKSVARVFTYEIILGNAILGLISLAFTGSLQQMSLITLIYISNKYWMFYSYDWLWSRIKWQTR